MAVKNTVFISITCEGPGCEKTVTFEQKDAQEVFGETAWLKTGRVIQTNDQRNFYYCSDQCEIGGIAAGNHNPVEKKKVISIDGGGTAAIKQAAAQAAAQEAATKAIREGQPATVSIG